MEPTSQQELKQLLNEGKISEREYRELFQSMSEKKTDLPLSDIKDERKSDKISKRGKIAFCLVLGGVVFAILGFLIENAFGLSSPAGTISSGLCILSLVFGLVGLVMGIMSWKTRLGKAATIIAAVLLTLPIISSFVYMFLAP